MHNQDDGAQSYSYLQAAVDGLDQNNDLTNSQIELQEGDFHESPSFGDGREESYKVQKNEPLVSEFEALLNDPETNPADFSGDNLLVFNKEDAISEEGLLSSEIDQKVISAPETDEIDDLIKNASGSKEKTSEKIISKISGSKRVFFAGAAGFILVVGVAGSFLFSSTEIPSVVIASAPKEITATSIKEISSVLEPNSISSVEVSASAASAVFNESDHASSATPLNPAEVIAKATSELTGKPLGEVKLQMLQTPKGEQFVNLDQVKLPGPDKSGDSISDRGGRVSPQTEATFKPIIKNKIGKYLDENVKPPVPAKADSVDPLANTPVLLSNNQYSKRFVLHAIEQKGSSWVASMSENGAAFTANSGDMLMSGWGIIEVESHRVKLMSPGGRVVVIGERS